jgi:hypothetical protein
LRPLVNVPEELGRVHDQKAAGCYQEEENPIKYKPEELNTQ